MRLSNLLWVSYRGVGAMGFPPLEMNDVIPNCTVKIYMYNEYLYMYQLRKSVLHTSGVHTLYM